MALPLRAPQPDLRRLRMAEGFGVRFVQNLHDAVVQFADRQRRCQQFFGGRRRMGEEVENLVNFRKRERIARAKRQRMGGISRNALDAVEHQLLQVGDLLALSRESARATSTCLPWASRPSSVAAGIHAAGPPSFGWNDAGLGTAARSYRLRAASRVAMA